MTKCETKMWLLTILLTAAVCPAVAAPTVRAQDVAVPVRAFRPAEPIPLNEGPANEGPPNGGPANRNQIQKKLEELYRQQAEQHSQWLHDAMALRVDFINNACNLSDAQSKKLGVAAKGAVTKHIIQWRERSIDTARDQLSGAVDEGGLQQAVIRWIEEPGGVAGILVQRVEDDPSFGDTTPIENHPFWKKAFEKILTPAQKQAYKQAQQESLEFRRRAVIQLFLAQIDQQLLLSPGQREAVLKLLMESMNDMRPEAVKGLMMAAAAPGEVKAMFNRLPSEELAKTLTAAQLRKWKQFNRRIGPPLQVFRDPFNQNLKVKVKQAPRVDVDLLEFQRFPAREAIELEALQIQREAESELQNQ